MADDDDAGLFSSLPDELVVEILVRVSARDLCAVGSTCRRLEAISSDNTCWYALLSPNHGRYMYSNNLLVVVVMLIRIHLSAPGDATSMAWGWEVAPGRRFRIRYGTCRRACRRVWRRRWANGISGRWRGVRLPSSAI